MKKFILTSTASVLLFCFATAQTPSSKDFHRSQNDTGFHRPPMKKVQGHDLQNHNQFAGRGKDFHRSFQKDNHFGNFNRVHLSKDQMAQMKTINENYHQRLLALQKNDNISLKEYKLKLAGLQKERKTKTQGIYTDEQKKQIAEQKKQMEINAQVRNAANLERMKLNLNLSDEQVAKIKSNQTALLNKMKTLHQNDALLPEQKKEEMKNLMQQQKESFKSVLTQEQQKKADSLRNNFKPNFGRMKMRSDVK
jgi:hypothetical protein